MKLNLNISLALAAVLAFCTPAFSQNQLPAIQGPGGPIMAQPVVNIGYDSGTGLPCVVGKDVTCVLSSSSSGGGGAVTIADGADVALGAKADSAWTTGDGTLIAINKAVKAAVDALSTVAAAPLASGTNVIGKVGIDQTTPGTTNAVQVMAGTTGGASSYTFEVAASDNHQVVKNGAGTVFTMDAFSTHTAAMFMRLYDAGTGFNGCNSATNLIWEGQIPGATTGAGFTKSWGDVGKAFTNGLSVCVTGAYGNTNTTSATASVASVNFGYK